MKVCVIGCVVLLGTLALTEKTRASDDWFGKDKALHFGISAGVSVAAYSVGFAVFNNEPPRVLLGAGVGLTAGIAKELIDLAGYGDPSWGDLLWDVLGVGTGVLIMWVIDRLFVPEKASGHRGGTEVSTSMFRWEFG